MSVLPTHSPAFSADHTHSSAFGSRHSNSRRGAPYRSARNFQRHLLEHASQPKFYLSISLALLLLYLALPSPSSRVSLKEFTDVDRRKPQQPAAAPPGSNASSDGDADSAAADAAAAREWTPQTEPILHAKLPKAYFLDDSISLAEFVAFEVRRFRRHIARTPNTSAVPAVAPKVTKKNRLEVKAPEVFLDTLIPSSKFREIDDVMSISAGLEAKSQEAHEIPIEGSEAEETASINPATYTEKMDFEMTMHTALHNILVSERHRLLICPVPGASSRAILSMLDPGLNVSDLRSNPTQTNSSVLRPLSAYAPRDRERFLTHPDFLRTALVRNPFERVLSLYRHGTKDEPESPSYREFAGHLRGHALGENQHESRVVSFAFLVVMLTKEPSLVSPVKKRVGEHSGPLDLRVVEGRPAGLFTSQTDRCGLGMIPYDFVEKWERRDQFIARLRKHTAVDGLVMPAKERLGLGPPSFERNSTVTQIQIDPKEAAWSSTSFDEFIIATSQPGMTKSRISKLFSRDFNLLGYESK